MSTHPRGQLVIQIGAMPADTNANGDIFGGWLVSHMDMGAGIAARRHAGCRVATAAIQSLNFLLPVKVGDIVSCYAELLKTGRSSMQFRIEAWTLSLWDDSPKKAAEGLFVFVALDQSGRPCPVANR